MSGPQEPVREASGSRDDRPSVSADETTPLRNPNTDTPMSPEDLNAFLDFQCAPNSGFLKRIFSREKNARRMYHAINWLINLLLIGQAALSIVLVAVDVGEKGHQKVVEILGIINGIITAILAIIKGQGLPGRYYQYAAGLREVMREVEELRRTIASNGVVKRGDLKKLFELYEKVEKENDMNTPDIWRSSTSLSGTNRS